MSDETAQDIINRASDLNALNRPPVYGGGPLEDLYAKTPGVLESLPFGGVTEEKRMAANAYLYAASSWLARAESTYVALLPVDDGNAADLAEGIVRVKAHIEYLTRLGYSPSLNGVDAGLASAAGAVRKAVENMTPDTATLVLGGVVLVLLLIVFLR